MKQLSPAEKAIHNQALNLASLYLIDLLYMKKHDLEQEEYNKNRRWWQPKKTGTYFGLGISIPPTDLLDEAYKNLPKKDKDLLGWDKL